MHTALVSPIGVAGWNDHVDQIPVVGEFHDVIAGVDRAKVMQTAEAELQ